MKITKTLEEAVNKGDLTGIYSTLYTVLHEDPAFSTGKFEQLLGYVRSRNVPGLMQPFDGERFESEDKWNEEYWALQASELVDNFCEERIEHLKKVGRKLYVEKKTSSEKDFEKKQHEIKKNRPQTRNIIAISAICLIAAALVILMIWLLAKKGS